MSILDFIIIYLSSSITSYFLNKYFVKKELQQNPELFYDIYIKRTKFEKNIEQLIKNSTENID